MWGKLHREFPSNLCVLGKANNKHPRYLSRRKAASSQEVHLEQTLEGIPENWKIRCFSCKVDGSWPWGRQKQDWRFWEATQRLLRANHMSSSWGRSGNERKTPHFKMKWDCPRQALASSGYIWRWGLKLGLSLGMGYKWCCVLRSQVETWSLIWLGVRHLCWQLESCQSIQMKSSSDPGSTMLYRWDILTILSFFSLFWDCSYYHFH